MTDDLQTKLAGEFRHQAKACREIGSPLYAQLCELVAADLEAGGVCWSVLKSHAHVRFGLAIPLRFLGGVHRLVQLGRAPELAGEYPSVGGTPTERLWPAFCDVVGRERDDVVAALDRDVQTNEVVRCAALSEGLRAIQARTGLPLSLREVGTSAGLNLQMDRFAYVDDDRIGGDPASRLRIVDRWRGSTRPSLADLDIVDRAGCDPNPIDPSTAEGRARLLGFLWPDQLDRRERTLAAIDLVTAHPSRIERANAETWLGAELGARHSGAVTVVFHSIVWQYIDKDERTRITALMEATGKGAMGQAPLAWLRFEPRESDRSCAALTLRLWDGSTDDAEPIELAISGFHGEWVELR